MFNNIFNRLKNALSLTNEVIDDKQKNTTHTSETNEEKVKRMVFVDLDNIVNNKSPLGQTLLDNLPLFLNSISNTHFSGEELTYTLYGNYAYLQVDLLSLPNNVVFIDTPWQKDKRATQADQLIINAAWFHSNITNDHISIFTNDCDFADTLVKMSFCKKNVGLLTNKLCKKGLLNATKNVIDTRLNMLSVGISACEIVAQNLNMLLARGENLLHHQTLSFCNIFACDNWQGYGSFQAFLEASLGKACDFSHKKYIKVFDAPRFNEREYSALFTGLSECESSADIYDQAVELIQKCEKVQFPLSIAQAQHFVSVMTPLIGQTKSPTTFAKQYFNWLKDLCSNKPNPVLSNELPALQSLFIL